MVKVVLQTNESQRSLFSRFRKASIRSGISQAARKKRWFISKTEERRIDRKKAIRRLKRRQVTSEQKRNQRY